MILNRREFLKAALTAIAKTAIPIPTAIPALSLSIVPMESAVQPWSRTLFDYALQDMYLARFIGKDKDSLIQVTF